jgi:hypothetical protein
LRPAATPRGTERRPVLARACARIVCAGFALFSYLMENNGVGYGYGYSARKRLSLLSFSNGERQGRVAE